MRVSEPGVRLGVREGAGGVAGWGWGRLLLLNARRMEGAQPQPPWAKQGALLSAWRPLGRETPEAQTSCFMLLAASRGIFMEGGALPLQPLSSFLVLRPRHRETACMIP